MSFITAQEPLKANAEVTDAELRTALDRIVRDSLMPITIGLGVQYVAFAVKHALTLKQPAATTMSLASGTGAVLAFGFFLAFKRWSIPERWAHPTMALMAGLLLCTNFLHLRLVAEPHQTANLLGLVIAAGFVLLSMRWLLAVIVATLLGWGTIVWLSPPSSAWLYYAFALLGVTACAIPIHVIRVRTLRRLERLRLENERQKAQLHLYATELEKLVEVRTTRLRELEHQRLESEKLAATGRMAARIAHEINNPLGAIKTAFNLLGAAVPPEHRHYHYLAKIAAEIDRIASIVRQMLDLYRPDTEAPKEFRAAETIRDIIALLKSGWRGRNMKFDLDLEQAREKIKLPENMLRQVIYNVVLNAIEASHPEGLIRITAEVAGHRLNIAVLDHGEGIPEAIKARIFEPFFTTKGNGKPGGMGLSICKSQIEAMNGSIEFSGQAGEGTVCRITIPLVENEKHDKTGQHA